MLETIAPFLLGQTFSIARSSSKHNCDVNLSFQLTRASREDIATCQTTYGKTILLSVGGATYTEGGFSDSASAVNAANNIWAIFGPQVSGSTVNRPFGSSAVDGFDFDFESSVSNMVPFANQLRNLMDADADNSGKKWYLTAAPQCPYPDSADNAMLDGAVFFDAIWVQFYNNYCGLQSFVAGATTQNNFNFDTWDNWAKTVSLNPAVKVLLGVPGSPSAAGSGYEMGSALAAVISYCQGFSSFGGVMTWDMSQIYANPGFLDGVYSDLAGGGTAAASSTTMKSTTTTLPSSTLVTVTTKTSATTTATSAPTTTASTGPGTVNQWGQCGGIGYTGSTVCVAPYTCVEISVWWSQCE
jgi:chitinase